MRILSFLMFIVIIISSCSSSEDHLKEALEGTWSIDTIYYNKYDIKICLPVNMVEFSFNGQSNLPVFGKYCDSVLKGTSDEFASINFVKSSDEQDTIPYRLSIQTKNEVFRGLHKIIFYKDSENNLFKMELFSDNLYIVCRKFLYDTKRNAGLIGQAEKLTWTTRPKIGK